MVTKNTLFLHLLKNHIREGKSEYKYLNDLFLTEHLFGVIVLSKYYAKRSTKTPLGGAIVHYVNNFSLIRLISCAFVFLLISFTDQISATYSANVKIFCFGLGFTVFILFCTYGTC